MLCSHGALLQSGSHLATLSDSHVQHGPLALPSASGTAGPGVLDHPDDVHALFVGDLAEDDVLVVEERRGCTGDEKLAPVGVGPGIRHGQQPRHRVLVLERFVRKGGVVVDARAARAVGVEEIAALDHEILDLEDKRRQSGPLLMVPCSR